MFRAAFLALLALAIPSTAHGKGPVVAYFHSSQGETAEALAQGCIDRGVIVAEQTSHHVRCEEEMSGFSGILTHLLIGNSYSTTPIRVIRFSINSGRGYTVVQAVAWVETQMAFGQMRRQQMDGKKPSRQLFAFLVSAGGFSSPPPPEAISYEASDTPIDAAEPVEKLTASKPTQPIEPRPEPPKPSRFGNSRIKCTTCR